MDYHHGNHMMVISILEAPLTDDQGEKLVMEFQKNAAAPPTAFRPMEGYLAKEPGTNTWRLVAVWQTREIFEEMRASDSIPRGILMFRAVGAEPTLTVIDVKERLMHPANLVV